MSTINLLPNDHIERRAIRRANLMCLVLFAIVTTSVLAAALVSEQNSSHTRGIRDRVDAAYADAARMILQMQHLEAQRSRMLHKAELTASLVERVPRSVLLAVITNALPTNCSLLDVDLKTARIVSTTPSSLAQPGSSRNTMLTTEPREVTKSVKVRVEMEIVGRAGTDVEVARFIANLARNPLMRSVDLVYSEEKLVNKSPTREFQIRLELKSDADAVNVLPPPEAPTPGGRETPSQTPQGRLT